ncbi:calcyclin-binding protein [Copidosoma floridanum]|uniref:calcyclin-binding protein n=1 Tax=Copidosoma floridanum TaxID=29053 RepID=UPI0006C9A924|nr:calcyclin-binding protein [Copidosoma floridanum]XP_014214377.1 calcyclin-binding protein [Copidosoma floridanum]
MSMSSRINEIKLDLEDLNSLLENATRQKSKDLISLEIRRLQSELINVQNPVELQDVEMKSAKGVPTGKKCYDIKLNNYAWDQSDNFVKLYVTLNKVESLPKEAVYCKFSDRSMELHVTGLENKNYILPINNLCEAIDTEKSYTKVKTDMIYVYLAKKTKKTWSHITTVEKMLKEAKSNMFKDDTDNLSADPNAGIMNIMKKMYQEGDDEMKKTIAKAWTESQEKKGMGSDLPGF